ncbi:hypothetical protein BC332_32854 [Capsicum chinense]|nr:hypothetical protein BC332_32854 [Capsicum chinense]
MHPNNCKIIELTPWDILELQIDYFQTGLLFLRPTSQQVSELAKSTNTNSLIDHLRASLSRTLDFFPPFQSRVEPLLSLLTVKFNHAIADGIIVRDILESKYVPHVLDGVCGVCGVVGGGGDGVCGRRGGTGGGIGKSKAGEGCENNIEGGRKGLVDGDEENKSEKEEDLKSQKEKGDDHQLDDNRSSTGRGLILTSQHDPVKTFSIDRFQVAMPKNDPK